MQLVEIQSNGTVRLAGKGKGLARFVSDQPVILANEKAFLNRLPAKMTQKQFQRLLEAS